MAKGLAGYIMYEHRKLEKELLHDAYMKSRNIDDSEDVGLFENVCFKEQKEQ